MVNKPSKDTKGHKTTKWVKINEAGAGSDSKNEKKPLEFTDHSNDAYTLCQISTRVRA